MHRFMFENGVRRFRAVEQGVSRLLDVGVGQRREHAAVGFLGKPPDLFSRRPSLARVRVTSRVGFVRVDAAREQRLEMRIDARLAEPALHQRVEAESRQVSFVEHQRMAERDRPRVVGLVPDEIEEHLRSLAIPCVPVEERLPIECRGDRGHALAWMVPLQGRFRTQFLTEPAAPESAA